MNSKSIFSLVAIPFAGVLLSSNLQAAVMYDGTSYTQDFDSLEYDNASYTWSNGTTLEGWYWADPDGYTASQYTVINKNSGTSSGLANQQDYPLSIGTYTDLTDRAFGTQSRSDDSDTTSDFASYGLQLVNDTGVTLTEFTLTFTAEQWRAIGGQSSDYLTFDYQVFSSDGSLTAATGWTDVDELTFETPITTSTSQWLDGNDSANQEVFTATITGIDWDDGEELWLRWSDVSGTHAMMAIDDITFTATVPEPSSYALLLGLSVGMLLVRRRRS
jgi:hypothetical protein